MRFLITGCRGFIGGSMGRYLAALGHPVLGLGRSAQPPAGWVGDYTAADVAHADLAPLVREWAPEVIFHAAGSASVGSSFAAPGEDLRATVQTLSNTLEAARRSGVQPLVIFPSSAAVYGSPATLPVPESAPLQPLSPYGFHKGMCELLAREYAECFGVRSLLCRLFSVFGPAQRRLLVYQIYEQLAGPAPEVRLEGTGEETRDYLYMDDLAALMLAWAVAEAPQRGTPACTALNVASGTATRVRTLAEALADLHGSRKPIRTAAAGRRGDPPHWQAEVTRLRQHTPGFQPRPLRVGLEACLAAWEGGA